MIPNGELARKPPVIRLKDLFNVRLIAEGDVITLSYAGPDLAEARAKKAPIIQWLPEKSAIPCTLLTQEGPVSGACEPGVATEIGKVVQFERVGFARIDRVEPQGLIAYFCHR
jgi:glutamyl-tRNA synthetase